MIYKDGPQERVDGVASAEPDEAGPDVDALAQRLAVLRDKRGFNNHSLALAAGLKPGYVHDIMRGKVKNPTAFYLYKLAEALGTVPEWLLFGTASQASMRPAITLGEGGPLPEETVSIAEALKIRFPACTFACAKEEITMRAADGGTISVVGRDLPIDVVEATFIDWALKRAGCA